MFDRAEVEVSATATRGATVPFWLHANTDGRVDPASSGGMIRGRVERTMPNRTDQTWAFGYGVEAVGRASAHETLFFPALYAEARYSILRARVGRKPETIGTVANPLTSGSMGTSRNATPIPKVLVRTDGYVEVPFTNQWMEFKGRYEHGWLPDGRFVDDAFLHQKSLYLRGGGPSPVQAHAGIAHKAMWGGNAPDFGRIPQSFSDYARVVVVASGPEDAPPADQNFIQGNHFGILDLGVSAGLGPFRVRAYHQAIYEDKNNLKLKNFEDGLTGIAVTVPRSRWWIDRVLYELVFTNLQNGTGPDGDNYYNHSIYESGWTVYGRMAASPLLTPFPRGSDRRGIANSRVFGHHLGIAGSTGSLDYRVLATYTRYFGTWIDLLRAKEKGENYRFDPPLEQTSVLIEARFPWPSVPQIQVTGAVGATLGSCARTPSG